MHALLGENGAGKTTLSHILTGLYRPDEGEILLYGEPVAFASPREAIDAGVCMVHQHFRLVERFTVAENLVLGDRRGAGRHFRIDPRAVEGQVRELGERYRLPVDPRAHVWQLSVGEQQRVEILNALYQDARVLILDEPTAVLTPDEADTLFVTLRQMAAEGRTVIFISHKLHEVMAVSDRVTVLRAGRAIGDGARPPMRRRSRSRRSWSATSSRPSPRARGAPRTESADRCEVRGSLGGRRPRRRRPSRASRCTVRRGRDRRRRRRRGQRPAGAGGDDRRAAPARHEARSASTARR